MCKDEKMSNQQTNPGQRTKRVAPVDNPRYIALDQPDRALEYFLDDPLPGYIHIMRFRKSSTDAGKQTQQEGVLIGQSDSPEAPENADWDGGSPSLRILSEINLGHVEVEICPETGAPLSTNGQINTDPIVFVNFDPATHQFREIDD